jgi:hypothetical protein
VNFTTALPSESETKLSLSGIQARIDALKKANSPGHKARQTLLAKYGEQALKDMAKARAMAAAATRLLKKEQIAALELAITVEVESPEPSEPKIAQLLASLESVLTGKA